MRILVALGGNALLRRGERPDADLQQVNVLAAAAAIAELATEHEVVLTHGNGPQVGMLALESAADPALTRPYPLDVLGAQTQGMIGYLLGQALQNVVPGKQVATLMTQTLVSVADPAFTDPTKFVGPVYTDEQAATLATERDWTLRPDGSSWRRVVPSPRPQRVVETPVIHALVGAGTIVVCAGGGGVPVVRDEHTGRLRGVEAVVDKDRTAALLAEALDADALLLLTDVPAVIDGYGTPHATPIHHTTPARLRSRDFPAGSMGPKVDAACRFVELTGKTAAIGALDSPVAMLRGTDGTVITPSGKPCSSTDETGIRPTNDGPRRR
ncbi:carbamate kinase [Amycolatopsis decaplanina]|uniref:Carbamate kinase n=1 Tax=Amycolatopsis decaplanina DSM 44594 TaxID=1284240 RepID=M2Z4R4_9PSEU|nr:carbamate kinase [Amycolatopsis decaplanina]EME55853.1 carbamate kinase [Amycolatopsis decaplanina DSM 44594]